MALKTAGFLAAIERGAHFIFQANPGKIYIWMRWKTSKALLCKPPFGCLPMQKDKLVSVPEALNNWLLSQEACM